MLTYKQACEFMDDIGKLGIVSGLDNIKTLCRILGNPQDKIKTIHIAGTNGKGSVGAYLSSILIDSGMRVGRYVSPAVMSKREVFSINGVPVSENSYSTAISKAADGVQKAVADGKPHATQFETETAAAFECFLQEKCDIALIECGMGGRLDATNVITSPLLSVITHISLDHTAFLGDTIEKIASEKAGIIKNGVPVVSSIQENSVMTVLNEKCRSTGSELYIVEKPHIISASLDGTEFEYNNIKLFTEMCGLYQAENAALATECARVLRLSGLNISDDNIRNGIKKAVWNGRFEVLRKNPPFIIDGAHNPDGAYRLAESIKQYFGDKKPCFIFGMFRDKDYDTVARLTAPLASCVYTVTPPTPRGLDNKVLCDTVKQYNENTVSCESIDDAIQLAQQCADGAVCFGSLSFLHDVKNKLTK